MAKKDIAIHSDSKTLDLIDRVSEQCHILERGYNGKIRVICELLLTTKDQQKHCMDVIEDLLEFISQEVPSNIICSSELLKKIQTKYHLMQGYK